MKRFLIRAQRPRSRAALREPPYARNLRQLTESKAGSIEDISPPG
jgi:hypothetical protein